MIYKDIIKSDLFAPRFLTHFDRYITGAAYQNTSHLGAIVLKGLSVEGDNLIIYADSSKYGRISLAMSLNETIPEKIYHYLENGVNIKECFKDIRITTDEYIIKELKGEVS